jgi:SAM-dependent methyltransferase
MGIPSQVARLILREHAFRPITGKLLSIGRQTVHLTPRQAKAMVEAELGIQLDVDPLSLEVDTSTREARDRGFISDRAFYSLFTDAEYQCLDQSDYENADIVFNLCEPSLPLELENRFDFIVDGGTLDNVFDPAAALRNLARIASPRGRIHHHDRASRIHNVYVAFALSWFHDYYSVNEFEDCQVYLAQWDDNGLRSRWDFYRYNPLRERDGVTGYIGQDTWFYPWRHGHVVVMAEKGLQSTWNKNPIQFEYRPNVMCTGVGGQPELRAQDPSESSNDPYVRAAIRFKDSRRPLLLRPEEKADLPRNLTEYAPEMVYCGSIEAIFD